MNNKREIYCFVFQYQNYVLSALQFGRLALMLKTNCVRRMREKLCFTQMSNQQSNKSIIFNATNDLALNPCVSLILELHTRQILHMVKVACSNFKLHLQQRTRFPKQWPADGFKSDEKITYCHAYTISFRIIISC